MVWAARAAAKRSASTKALAGIGHDVEGVEQRGRARCHSGARRRYWEQPISGARAAVAKWSSKVRSRAEWSTAGRPFPLG